ncbi:MAG: HEAT repeat domain-containing protein [Candidatus Omnitrophica bacterium]|nr:HEAT repeat domain-containing protein [Candidatus Omnitrophota bacterium]
MLYKISLGISIFCSFLVSEQLNCAQGKPTIPSPITAIVSQLNLSDPVRQAEAAAKISRWSSPPKLAIPMLIKCLSDDTPVRLPQGFLTTPAQQASAALLKYGSVAVEPLQKAWETSKENTQKNIAKLLIKMKSPSSAKIFIELLQQDDSSLRAEAVMALGVIRCDQAVEPLIKLIADREPSVRKEVALALGEIGQPQAFSALVSLLTDNVPGVRAAAVKALGRLNHPESVPHLCEKLKDKEEIVRWSAAASLGQLKDPRTVLPLIQALSDSHFLVRANAAWSLGLVGDRQATEPLICLLRDKDVQVKIQAVRALGRIGDSRAVESLILVLNERHPLLRRTTLKTLRRLTGVTGANEITFWQKWWEQNSNRYTLWP